MEAKFSALLTDDDDDNDNAGFTAHTALWKTEEIESEVIGRVYNTASVGLY
jgi:hypothetical protein